MQIEEIEENCFELSCTQFDFITLWANYFDIDGGTDYEGIKAAAAEKGGLIADAVAEGAGIRILRQTAWEMLITFLTAQNISIARATTLIERLCEKYGCWKQTEGVEFTEFPTPEALATATPKDLRALGFVPRSSQKKRRSIVSAIFKCRCTTQYIFDGKKQTKGITIDGKFKIKSKGQKKK